MFVCGFTSGESLTRQFSCVPSLPLRESNLARFS